MLVKFKKLNDAAVIPAYSRDGDVGLDLTATSKYENGQRQLVFGFGLAVEIPPGHYGLIAPRSSIYKTGLRLSNSIGILDENFRGEIKAIFDIVKPSPLTYNAGDRIAQLIIMPYPKIEPVEADELSDTNRGTNGFGSSGK